MEYIIRAFIPKTDPLIRIDMVHHSGDIILGILSNVCTLGNKAANEFMISFGGAFLVRSLWITEENPGSPRAVRCEFNMRRIRELAAIVRQTKLKNTAEALMPEALVQGFKYIFHRLCIISVPQESKHHLTVNEVNGEKNLSTPFANDRIKLSDRRIRIFIHKAAETIVISIHPAGAIHFKCCFFFFLAL